MSYLLRGGTVVDPILGEREADVLVEGDRIVAVGHPDLGEHATVIDAGGRLVLPGAIDPHSHADAFVFDDDVQLGLLRQGVTTVIGGQDGVSFAPGDGGYAAEYFGGINGPVPSGYDGGGVGELLRSYDGGSRLNAGYLVPAGTVRHVVMGSVGRTAGDAELAQMVALIEQGLRDGALGLSSGLDYVPGCFADWRELAAMCVPVAAVDGVYVTHMRGYEEKSAVGMAEVREIRQRSGVRAHISHFHARAELIAHLLAEAERDGGPLSFDAYPYFRGSSLLSMLLLPPEVAALGGAAVAAALRDPAGRAALLPTGLSSRPVASREGWSARITVAGAGSPEWSWAEGRTLADIAASLGLAPEEASLRLLADSALAATVVMEVVDARDDDELAVRFALDNAMCGSDGIYSGSRPHPRGWGAFSRLLQVFGVDRGDFTWPELADLVSGRAARCFGLAGRGRVIAGAIADLALVDPSALRSAATYDAPRTLSTGIADVFVAGVPVLTDGVLTDARPGTGIRRGSS